MPRSTPRESGPDAEPIVVGWREVVAFPDWGIPRVRAKIDTGARTSAIHAAHIDELPDGRVRFEVVTRERPERRSIWVEATPVRRTIIKPSSGERQVRIVCRTRMRVGPLEREIELSLVSREGMLCRLLVGRTALEGALVDPQARYLHGRRAPIRPRRRRRRLARD